MRIMTAKNWNEEMCPPSTLSTEALCVSRESVEWVVVYRFAAYAQALVEAKRGWQIATTSVSSVSKPSDEVIHPPAEDGFERQKQEFMSISPETLAQYRGKFVASRNGVIVDHDSHLVALSHRVREHYGNLPVYITRIGKAVRMPTPFVVR